MDIQLRPSAELLQRFEPSCDKRTISQAQRRDLIDVLRLSRGRILMVPRLPLTLRTGSAIMPC